MAVVTGDPKVDLRVPLAQGMSLNLICSSEVETMDWMELINQSITIARKGKNRGSVVSKTKKKRTVIVAESTKDTVRMGFKRKKAAPDNA